MKAKFCVLLTMFGIISSALAVDGPSSTKTGEKMRALVEFGTPGESHRRLAELAGKWKYTSTWRESPGAKPEESTGTASMKMVLDGRFLQQSIKGTAMGRPFEGMGIVGYDNLKKRYENVWLDNMSTGMARGTAMYDIASKTLMENGEFSCPATKDKVMTYRAEWKLTDKDNQTYTMWTKDVDGKEFKSMEMVYKRVK